MNELKYQIVQFLFIIILGFGAYWALTQLDTGVSYTRDNMVRDPHGTEIVPSPSEPEEELPVQEIPEEPESEPSEPAQLSGLELELQTGLQALINDNVFMQTGSRGTRVGVVQRFLDWYFDDRTVSIDNDYGPTTRELVRAFQTAEGLDADGQAGPNTYRKMIEILSR